MQNNFVNTFNDYSALLYNKSKFNIGVNVQGYPITDQDGLGICWLYAATNSVRLQIMTSLKISNLDISVAYLFLFSQDLHCGGLL